MLYQNSDLACTVFVLLSFYVTNQAVYTCKILVRLVLLCLVRFSCSSCPHWQHREFVANNYSPAQFGDDSGHFPDGIQEDHTAPILGGSDFSHELFQCIY
jgi:hypothetical protein